MSDARQSFDVLVVGAGPAGVAAAAVAAECGQRVAIVDETPWLGGQIWRGDSMHPKAANAQRWLERLRRSNARVVAPACLIAQLEPGVYLAESTTECIELVADRLILANGARELFLPFPGWTLPNVMGAGGLQVMAKLGWPVEGRRVVVAGSGPLLLAVGAGLAERGAEVVCIAEQATRLSLARFAASLWREPGKLAQAAAFRSKLKGVRYRPGVWPVRAEGVQMVERVILTDGHSMWSAACDLLAVGFGLVPNVDLAAHLGCDLADGFVRVDERQRTSVPDIHAAGEVVGIGGADCALVEGQIAGFAAAGQFDKATAFVRQMRRWRRFRRALSRAFAPRGELARLAEDATIVCRCEDVPFGRLNAMTNWRQAKLHTRCGMGPCQGRVCGGAARVIWGWSAESVRPPVVTARMRSLLPTAIEDQRA